jgi:hypothetical protein
MSAQQVQEQAEREQAENARAEELTNAFLALMHRKEAEHRDRLTTYRDLVFRAADNGGQLSQSDLDRLVDVTRTLDLTVDQFSADVAAVNRDREHEAAISAISDKRAAATREHDAAAEEEAWLSRGWGPVREEYETRRREHDERISKVRRDRERSTNAIDRLSLEASKRGDRQSHDRHSHRRVWGPW